MGARIIVCKSVRKSFTFREQNAERESRETAYACQLDPRAATPVVTTGEIAAAARSKGNFARIRGCVFLEAVPFFPLFPSHHGLGLVCACDARNDRAGSSSRRSVALASVERCYLRCVTS